MFRNFLQCNTNFFFRFIPTAEHISVDSWVKRKSLGYGNLMARGTRGAMLLAGEEMEVNNMGAGLVVFIRKVEK